MPAPSSLLRFVDQTERAAFQLYSDVYFIVSHGGGAASEERPAKAHDTRGKTKVHRQLMKIILDEGMISGSQIWARKLWLHWLVADGN